MLDRGRGEASVRRTKRAAASGLVAAALILGVAAPVIGEGENSRPSPAVEVVAATTPATSAQVSTARGLAAASVSARRKKGKTVFRQVTMNSRITDNALVTAEGQGTFVGIKCPAGSKAISGGVLSQYINLLVSSSAPNHPLTGKFTPNIWWLTVTNVNVDGQGGSLSWRGVVNCLTPIKLGNG